MRLSQNQLDIIRSTRSGNSQRGTATLLRSNEAFAGISPATIYSAVRRLDRETAKSSEKIRTQVEANAAPVC